MVKKIKKRHIFLGIVFLLTTAAAWIIWGNLTVQTSYFKVTSKDLPEEFDEFSIAQISDLHNAEYGSNNEKLLSILKKEEPDIITITGDLIDSSHTNMKVALDFVGEAIKIAPCYYVTGNHEAWIGSQYKELKNALENMGVVILQDEVIQLKSDNSYIQLIGLNDPDFSTWESYISENVLETKLSALDIEDGFTLLLAHRPECYNIYQDKNIDLVLSGHAHGGQFRLPLIGGIVAPNQGFFPKYDAGMYTENGTTMIVSRGIGNSIIPVRINNRPEIVMIELNCER